ncbi:MAG: ATP-binding protein [Oscillospiraceae bacterium]|nr:ATP-binding protein [Oscillospiraceae bacterium]
MLLKRKIYNQLLNWKTESNGTSALLISGARRVGKSFICKQFGNNEYKSMIIVDFSKPSSTIKDIFENDINDLNSFFSKLSSHFKTVLYKRESLIVFDEVQLYPLARQAIKHLVEDGRYDYIETGSLLSIKQNVSNILMPSEEEEVEMHPLDFEEFLWAIGDEVTFSLICSHYKQLKPLGQGIHRQIMNDFRQYMLVGGMPQSVLAYIGDKDFYAADKEKVKILKLYRNDVTKYAKGYEVKVTSLFDSLPGQLSKREKKYKLASVSKNARMREYEDAFMWLSDAMIVNTCFNATDPGYGLGLSLDHTTHKLYMADTGLLVTHACRGKGYINNELYRAILFDKLNINEGMIMENIVAQMLRASGHRFFFYSRTDANYSRKTIEIDFLINIGSKVCPVEVKSSAYRAHSSLDKFRRKFENKLGDAYILYSKDVMIKDDIIHLPLYMASLL